MSHREELAALRSRLASTTPKAVEDAIPSQAAERIRELETTLGAVSAEVTALRTSRSWRLTGPLREVYGWWIRRRGSE
ncbi:MAG: hypothetical protein DMF94_34130 [Acidobacteria bacterium]|nr:MAG: hypothetical protein DMF94_34130 [Acidobacteriota bacterium]